MKMKQKSLLMTLMVGLILIGVSSLKAQTTTASATLNVKLHPILNIALNNGSTVDLEFSNSDDYAKGVSKPIADHLAVNSTSGFTVTVKADGDLTNGSKSIPISDIFLTSSDGTANPIDGIDNSGLASALSLNSTSEQPIFKSTSCAAIGTIDVLYKAILGSNDFSANSFGSTDGVQTYTATVTYTITSL